MAETVAEKPITVADRMRLITEGERAKVEAAKRVAEAHAALAAAQAALEASGWQQLLADLRGAQSEIGEAEAAVEAVDRNVRAKLFGGVTKKERGRLERLAEQLRLKVEHISKKDLSTAGSREYVFNRLRQLRDAQHGLHDLTFEPDIIAVCDRLAENMKLDDIAPFPSERDAVVQREPVYKD